ncbi:beta-1,4-galactosyltransferase 1-like isoform 2-T2 [Anomaloglossus baeobatrachus]|uniref:beta-1,4-galactosyltransferase 1-like isoform X2 n=1 Tax=Anomaloglossus baeobatrachus TaxID=238106 RepID=UPI003F500775
MTWTKKTLFYILSGLCLFSFGLLFGKSSFLIMNSHFVNERFKVHFQSSDMVEDSNIQEMPVCPELPPHLTGPFNVDVNRTLSLSDIMSENSLLQEGGRGKPQFCKAQQKIAIIIPFRDREPHLTIWLHYMLPLLQKQQGDFGIYVVEQSKNTTFNRAKLMNIGYSESIKDYDYNCFIFTDVDLIPMNDRNLYRCSKNPRHMANALDKFNFRLPYQTLFGGIVAFTKEQFLKVNGFSNRFWGWGGEDDELYNRVIAAGMKVERPDLVIARSKAIFHHRDSGNEKTGKSFHLINQAAKFMHTDGLNSLKYDIINCTRNKLYTKVTVNLGTAE